jgi:uncharacterized damage-inducible protein DinB
MKEVIAAFAKYNKGANLALLDALDKAGTDIAKKASGTFYKTILATIQHCLWSELTWLKRYKVLGDYSSLRADILGEDVEALKVKIGEDYQKTVTSIKEMDSIFSAFADEIKPEDLQRSIKFKNAKGEEQERICWQTIFHVLNHGTHHRGEISGVLDNFGVNNDFSGFFKYL